MVAKTNKTNAGSKAGEDKTPGNAGNSEAEEIQKLRERALAAENKLEETEGELETAKNVASDANKEANDANAKADKIQEDANIKAAEAAIEISNANSARDEAINLAAKVGGVKRDKSIVVDPKRPPKFNESAYFGECHGEGVAFAQAGWFYNNKKEPVRPVNPVAK